MGVDPKTGSYLSKEQRVAMFRASRGQDVGGGGGSRVPGSGSRPGVQPQSAIVVRKNQMSAIVQNLGNATSEEGVTLESLAQQVRRNTKDIATLFTIIKDNQTATLEEEKAETKKAKKKKEGLLRKSKEVMVEGMAKAAAGLAEGAKKVGESVSKPIMGFLDRLKSAATSLLMGWLIQSLPSILEKVQEFADYIVNFKDNWKDSIGQVRGVWVLLDGILKNIYRTVRGIVNTAIDVGKWIVRQGKKVVDKVFKPIGEFLDKLIRKTISSFKRAFGSVLRKLKDLIPDKFKRPQAPKGQPPKSLPDGKATPPKALPETPKPKNVFQRFGSWVTKKGSDFMDSSKNLLNKGRSALKGIKGSISSNVEALKSSMGDLGGSVTKRMSWLEDAFAPIAKRFPGVMRGFNGMARGVLRQIPLLGFGIDLALNKGVAGQDWTEAIMRAIGSAGAGMIGAWAGAKVGAPIGAALGAPFFGLGAGPGALIGGGIGAIIGSMLAGQIGDDFGADVFEGLTGEKRTEYKTDTDGVTPVVPKTSVDMNLDSKGHTPDLNMKITDLSAKAFDGPSTPAGMEIKDAYTNSVNIIEMPPVVTDLSKKAEKMEPTPAQLVHNLFTADPDMDAFRVLSAHEYQLVN